MPKLISPFPYGGATAQAIDEASSVGTQLIDGTGRVVHANAAFCRMVGWTRDELVGFPPPYACWPDEDVANLQRLQQLAWDGHFPQQGIRIALKRRSGERFPALLFLALLGSGNESGGLVANVVDLSDLPDPDTTKAAEADLRRGLEQLRLATEGADIGLWYWSMPGDKLEWSDRCRTLFELPAGEEPSFEHFFRAVHPDDRQRLRALLAASVELKVAYRAEYRIVHAEGSIRWISAPGRIYTNPDGSLRSMGGIVIDITESKRVADELERMRTLMAEGERIAGLGAWEYVVGTQETIWSEGECLIYGVDPLQKSPDYQRMLQERIHPEDAPELDRVFGAALQERKPYSLDHRIVRPDGTIRIVRDLAQPHFDAAGDLVSYVGITMDITESKRAEAEVLEARRKLEVAHAALSRHRDELEQSVQQRTRELAAALDLANGANRAKTAFLGTVSHELRTPLNAVIGFSTLLLDGSIAVPLEEQRKPLSVIRQSGQHLLDLVQEILDLSGIEAGNLSVVPVPVDLRTILEESRDAMLLKATERALELRPVACEPGLLVLADPKRLGQVVRNLLSNALKFTDHGFVQVQASSADGLIHVEVVDTGIGIPADQQSCLFQPFQRVTGGQAHLRPGTGLGLAISRRVVEAMGGTIGFESEVGRGSRFWFTLPAASER